MSHLSRRVVALLLAGLLSMLAGCSAMLEAREYTVVQPVGPGVQVEDDPNILRAENYEGIMTSLIYFVENHNEKGTLRLYNYKADVDADLRAAQREMTQEDPLGSYAVEYMTTDVVNVVSYYEVTVYITYQRTAEQTAAIKSAVGGSAIRNAMAAAMPSYPEELVLQMGRFDQSEENLLSLYQESYLANPEFAMGYPEMTTAVYPASGNSYQPIVEFIFVYPRSIEDMARMAAELEEVCLGLDLNPVKNADDVQAAARSYFERMVTASETGGDTAYHAFVEHSANNEGMELGWRLMCTLLGIAHTTWQLEEAPA